MASPLIPAEPRAFRGLRMVKISLRAIHVLCAGIFTAAYVLPVEVSAAGSWSRWTALSGVVLLSVHLFETGAFLLQVRGLVVLAKIALFLLLPALEGWQPQALVGVLFFSVVLSHAPSSLRHHLVFGRGRVHGARTKG